MSFFTIILLLFVLTLYVFLFLIKREVIFPAKRKAGGKILVLVISGLALLNVLSVGGSVDEQARGLIAVLILLSLLIDGRGLTAEKIVTNSLDKRGIYYTEIEEIVLLQTSDAVKLNFFYQGRRGPLLKFSASAEELNVFFSERVNANTVVKILKEE
ncbi:MAG: hypothetical protein ACK5MW_06750 [Enterococcus sp.]